MIDLTSTRSYRLAFATGLVTMGLTACAPSGVEDALPPSPPATPGLGMPLVAPAPALGPELGLDAPVLGPSMRRMERPAAAFNGSSYLVVWHDSGPTPVFGARMAQDGTVLDPVARPLPLDGERMDVASNGDGFLVVGGSVPLGSDFVAARVSAAGDVLGTSVITSSQPYEAKVASNGAGYLVVWSSWSTLHYARVASDGTVLDPGGILLDAGMRTVADVSFDGTNYVIAWDHDNANGRVATVSPGGTLLQQATLPMFLYAMECDAGRCVVVWAEEEYGFGARVSWMTPQGVVLDPQGAPPLNANTWDGQVSLGFDGQNAVVAWSNGDVDCSNPDARFSIVTEQGALQTPEGVQLAGKATAPVVAWDGERAFFAWSDSRLGKCSSPASIYGARLAEDGTVLDADGVLISRSANGQLDPSLAFDGQDVVVAWSDERNYKDLQDWDAYAARLSPEGDLLDPAATLLGTGPARQYPPRASFDGASTVVAWWDCFAVHLDDWDCIIRGTRLGQGAATPLTFPYHTFYASYYPPALSGGGGADLVSAFSSGDGLATAAIGPSGVAGPDVSAEVNSSLNVVSAFDGINHLVVWLPKGPNGGPLLGARVAPDGTVLDPGGFPVAPPGSDVRGVSLAFGGGQYLVAWHDATTDVPRVLAARVSPGGVVLDPTPVVVAEAAGCDGYQPLTLGASAVAFDGQRFAIGWSACGPESDDLFGAMVDAQGVVRAHFPITSDAHADRAPALVAVGADRTLVAYSSFRSEAPLAAWRVYTRTLDATPLNYAMP